MKNKSVLKITNSTPRRIHLKRGTHKSHPLGFPLYSGFSSYIYIYIYTHMCRYIGVDRGRYTNSLVPPSRYRFTIVRATLPNFGVTMGLCLAEAGSPGSSLEIRPNRLRHETKEKARKRGPRNETGGRERELEHEGRGISLRVTTLFALARNQRLAELTRSPLRAH